MQLDHPHPFDNQWRAKWIWNGRSKITMRTSTRTALADPRDRIVLFRRELKLSVVPSTVPARMWVDGRYVLSVNGVEIARGPVRSEPRSARYDVVDLAPHLVVGDNVIAIVARHFGEATSWWVPDRCIHPSGRCWIRSVSRISFDIWPLIPSSNVKDWG